MFTRFQANVRRWPRTFAVLCLAISATLLADYGTGRAVGISAKSVSLYLLALIAVALVIDTFIYRWFMGSAVRVNGVLSILNTFDPPPPVAEGCGDPDCEVCASYAAHGEELSEEMERQSLIDDEEGQDVAEYAVMLAVILVIAVGTIHLIGSSANNVFSQIGSQIQ